MLYKPPGSIDNNIKTTVHDSQWGEITLINSSHGKTKQGRYVYKGFTGLWVDDIRKEFNFKSQLGQGMLNIIISFAEYTLIASNR